MAILNELHLEIYPKMNLDFLNSSRSHSPNYNSTGSAMSQAKLGAIALTTCSVVVGLSTLLPPQLYSTASVA